MNLSFLTSPLVEVNFPFFFLMHVLFNAYFKPLQKKKKKNLLMIYTQVK